MPVSSRNCAGRKTENNEACAESAFCVSAQQFSCCPKLSLKKKKKNSGKRGNEPVKKKLIVKSENIK